MRNNRSFLTFHGCIALVVMTSGCASLQVKEASPLIKTQEIPATQASHETAATVSGSPESIDEVRATEQEIIEADTQLVEEPDRKTESNTAGNFANKPAQPRIPIEINRNVRKWVHFFAVKDRARFQRFLDRGIRYKPLIQEILKEHGIPRDLYYLALIESGFSLHATSHANAVGAWQFIRGTGLRYGLVQNRDVDERRDIIRSTHAAARYLKNLHTAFQSWYLAMASYNAGEGRILGAILRGGTRDFWELVERKALPRETRNYVPKFLAAMMIGRHPEKYGFKVASPVPFPKVEQAEFPGGVRLIDVSRKSGIPLETLKEVNPHLRRAVTPVQAKSYAIWVPKEKADQVAALAMSFARREVAKPKVLAASGKRHRRVKAVNHASTHYRVRRGDALALIAARYNVSVSKLRRLNDLRSNHIFVGQKLRVRDSL